MEITISCNKLVCHNSIDAGKRQEDLVLKIKNGITQGLADRGNIGLLILDSPAIGGNVKNLDW